MTSRVSLIGVPSDIGASDRGASMGPEALRVAGLVETLEKQGVSVPKSRGENAFSEDDDDDDNDDDRNSDDVSEDLLCDNQNMSKNESQQKENSSS